MHSINNRYKLRASPPHPFGIPKGEISGLGTSRDIPSGVAAGEVGQGEIRGTTVRTVRISGFAAGETPERASFAPCPTTNGYKVLGTPGEGLGPYLLLQALESDRNQS